MSHRVIRIRLVTVVAAIAEVAVAAIKVIGIMSWLRMLTDCIERSGRIRLLIRWGYQMEYKIKSKAWLIVGAALISMPAWTQSDAEFDANIERMTDFVIGMSPVVVGAQKAMAMDPKWPLQDRAHLVSDEELGCLRNQLSSEQLRKKKRDEVHAYALADRKRFVADLKLLDTGLPKILANSVEAGLEATRTGQRLDPAEVLKDVSANQLLAMNLFIADPKHQALRELTDFSDAFKAGSASNRQQAAQTAGKAAAAKLMFAAMDECSIKPARLMAAELNGSALPSLQFDAQCNRPAPQPVPPDSKVTLPRPDPQKPNAFPEYPLASKRMGEEGAVNVTVYVTEEGKVSRAQLARTSGSSRLDQAALEGTREWRYLPGRIDGRESCMWVTTVINFKLRDAEPQAPPTDVER